MRRNRKIAVTLTATSVVAVILVLAVWLSLPSDQSLAHLQQTGTIRIGYAVEAPYAFLKPGGDVTGESPEVAKQIVAQLGIAHIEWQQVEFGNLLTGLESGRFDVIAAGMFITPERARRVSFSEPTFHVQQSLLVAKGNPYALHTYEQALTQPRIRIAVIAGSVEENLLRQLGLPEAQRVAVPDALTGRVAVETGVADGLALSSPTIQWMALREQLGKTEIARPFTPPALASQSRLGYGGFAFRPSDHRLSAAWNAALKTYVGSAAHQQLIAAFGFTPAELPGIVTTQEIVFLP